MQGAVNVKDFQGKPALGLLIDMPRDFYRQGKKTLLVVFGTIVSITVAFGILILLLIETVVLKRLLRINREVTAITESLDFTQTLPIQGKDEIAELASSINCMVCAMSEFLSATQQPRDRG